MTTKQLFTRKFEHLEKLAHSRDTYDALEKARIIRQLIFEGQSLTSQLWREHPELRKKLSFKINNPKLIADIEWIADGLHPNNHPFPNLQELDLDKFLTTPVIKYGSEYRTVGDVVEFLANKDGGVHRDRPNADSILSELQDDYIVAGIGNEGVSSTMRGIAEVVLSTLEPFYKAIKSSSIKV